MTDSEANTSTDNLVGTTIDQGRYEILRVIGEGGTGRVYEARQTRIDRLVAVKVLHNHWVTDPKLVKRFKQEAFTASQLRHPNTVIVIDYGETERGDLYIVMELLKGQSLLSLVEREGPLSLDRALKIIEQACGAVGEVHRCGILHRDLKPENIQIDPRDGHPDFVKLLDFSIAKLVNNDVISSVSADQNLTLQGAVFGTPQYMSPEQVRGKVLDERTDVYALGIIFYQVLSGFVPFYENTPQGTMVAHLTEPVPRFEDRVPHLNIHPEAAQIVYDCLEKDPKERISSSDELARRLADLRSTLQREIELREAVDSQALGDTLRFISDSADNTLLNKQGDTSKASEASSRSNTEPSPPPQMESKSSQRLKSPLKVSHPNKPKVAPPKLSASLGLKVKSEQTGTKRKEKGSRVSLKPQRPLTSSKLVQHVAEQKEDVSLEDSAKGLIDLDADEAGEDSFSAQSTQEYNPEIHGTLHPQESAQGDSPHPADEAPDRSHDTHAALKASSEVSLDEEQKTEAAPPHPRELNQASASTAEGELPNVDSDDWSDLQELDDLEPIPTLEGETALKEAIEKSSEGQSLKAQTKNEPPTLHQVSGGGAQGSKETDVETGEISILPPPLPDSAIVDSLFDQPVDTAEPTAEVTSTAPLKPISVDSPLAGSQESTESEVSKSLLAPPLPDHEVSVSTGVFQAKGSKPSWVLPVLLFFVVASVVFVLMTPELFTSNDQANEGDKGSAGNQSQYLLESTPPAQIFDETGELIARTPYTWELTERVPQVYFTIKAKGYRDEKIDFSMFASTENSADRKTLSVKLKPKRGVTRNKTSAKSIVETKPKVTRERERDRPKKATKSQRRRSRKVTRAKSPSHRERGQSSTPVKAKAVSRVKKSPVRSTSPQPATSQSTNGNGVTATSKPLEQPQPQYVNPHPRVVPELIPVEREDQPKRKITIEIPRVE